jgi:hypothetical protein
MDEKSMLTAPIAERGGESSRIAARHLLVLLARGSRLGSGSRASRFCSRADPRPSTRFGSAALALLALALSACDRDDGSAARSRECARFCEALEKCDDATDLLDCRDQCEEDDVRSDRYYRARADCGEELSCSRWVKEVNSRGEDVCSGSCNLIDCVDDALGQLKLSDPEKNMCMAIATKLNACDASLEPGSISGECEGVLPVLSEAYLEASVRCSEQLCAQISSCVEKLADRHQTDLKLFSGP